MEKILTKHPAGKSGRNIDREKYDVMKKLIVRCLKENEMTFTEISNSANKKLKGKFKGSIPWYLETVKLDLEMRKVIQRIPKTRPQKYRLVKK